MVGQVPVSPLSGPPLSPTRIKRTKAFPTTVPGSDSRNLWWGTEEIVKDKGEDRLVCPKQGSSANC